MYSYLRLTFLTVSAFFSSSRPIFSSLPSVVTLLRPQSMNRLTATAASDPIKHMQGLVTNLCGLVKDRKIDSNSSLLYLKSSL